jgi:hypothetical protein
MQGSIRSGLTALLLMCAFGCHAGAVLDRSTGATVTVSAHPWVFALEQPQFAVNSRDYIALYAAEINVTGRRSYHLAAFFWSTVTGRERFAGTLPTISLRIDDRLLALDSHRKTPREMGISQWPLKPPGHGALLAVYEVDASVLRQMLLAQQVQLRPTTDTGLPEDVWFDEWRSGRKAFAAFVDQTFASP